MELLSNAEVAHAALEDQCVRHFDPRERTGVALIAVCGLVSIVAILILFGLVLRNVFRFLRDSPGGEWRLINSHIEAYLLSLLLADFLTAVGATLNLEWAVKKAATCGTATCDVQGALQVIGPSAVALSTLAVAVHTFLLLFYRWTPRRKVTWILVVIVIWSFVILFTLIAALAHSSKGTRYFMPAPTWCWVNQRFVADGLGGQYSLMWLTALASLILYPLLFFRLRGNIHVHPDRWSSVRFSRTVGRASGSGLGVESLQAHNRPEYASREAMKMLWYPLCYIVIILPLSAVRWEQSVGTHMTPFAASVVAECIFKLSGLVNVVLFLLTRPNLLLFRQRRNFKPPPPSAADIAVSFFNSPVDGARDSNAGTRAIVLRPLPVPPDRNLEYDDEDDDDLDQKPPSPTGSLERDHERGDSPSDEDGRGRRRGSLPQHLPIRFPSPTISFAWDARSRISVQLDQAAVPVVLPHSQSQLQLPSPSRTRSRDRLEGEKVSDPGQEYDNGSGGGSGHAYAAVAGPSRSGGSRPPPASRWFSSGSVLRLEDALHPGTPSLKVVDPYSPTVDSPIDPLNENEERFDAGHGRRSSPHGLSSNEGEGSEQRDDTSSFLPMQTPIPSPIDPQHRPPELRLTAAPATTRPAPLPISSTDDEKRRSNGSSSINGTPRRVRSFIEMQ